jgi:indole-3-glycerol phosphate synthase
MNILDRIVERKKEEVAEAKKRVPEAALRNAAADRNRRRPFMEALEQPGPNGANVIAEIKRASPSKGLICPDLMPEKYATTYEQGGASALSVLTDRSFFQGGPEDLKAARSAVSLPVLRKDFLISAYQIFESAAWEADAVLLITRILSRAQLKEYLDLAASVHLDVLVEVHTEADIEMACRAGARLIGINNRNLTSFQTDIQTAVQLVQKLAPDQIPVAESGIHSREDIDRLKASGIWNFLIGESIVRSKDPKAFIQKLLGT